MNQTSTSKQYDLEKRTYDFGRNVLMLIVNLPKNSVNYKLTDQVIRSATSVGSNYLEANDSLGKKDFLMRMRIARKEAKETAYWLRLLFDFNVDFQKDLAGLIDECGQIKKILSAITVKSE